MGGRFYEQYHTTPYNPALVSERVRELYGDFYVKNKCGIFEYVLKFIQTGEKDTKLLDIWIFDDAVKQIVYRQQTERTEREGVSNCSYCAIGHDANKTKIWGIKDMDADHVTAWSRQGATNAENCEMLCKTHNRAKGNR